MIDPTTSDALQQMASHVAVQLVAAAMKRMVANVPALPVTVTLHPQPEPQPQRRLMPAPIKRRGRKPGPKPKKAGGRKKWTAAQHAKFSRTMAARSLEGKPAARPVGRPRKAAAVAEDRCTRCDHTREEHDAQTGKCLSFRCACTGFWK